MDKEHISLKPAYLVIVTIIAAITGMLGSVFADNIKNSFPLTLTNLTGWSWSAFLFWALLLLSALGIGIRAKYASNKFKNTTKRLEDLITTMPIDGFMSRFRDNFKDSHSILLRSEDNAKSQMLTTEDLELNIRSVLDSILDVISFYESKSKDSIYGINIMLFAELASIEKKFDIKTTEESISDYLEKNNFTPMFFGKVGSENLEGILVLLNELSTRSDIENTSDDNLPHRLCFPLWQLQEINNKQNTLPGAPYTFQSDDFYYLCSDVEYLNEWIIDNCYYESQVLDEVTNYFLSSKNKNIKSFLSFKIELDGEKYGIMNVHSDHTNLLSSGNMDSQIFIPCLEPFVAIIGRLIRLRQFCA